MDMFAEDSIAILEKALPQYVTAQRWFRAKARTVRSLEITGDVPLKSPEWVVLVIRIEYADGENDVYLLPVQFRPEDSGDGAIARIREGAFYDALGDEEFRTALLDAIGCDEVFEGRNGRLVTSRTNAYERQCGQWVPELGSKVSRAEQSNSSIIYGDRYILKLFRKLESGINPDIEIGKFLTDRGFTHIPAVLGEIRYESGGDVMYAGILQAFVANEGDAWKYTLDELSCFFDRALREKTPPERVTAHPFDLLCEEVSALERQIIGEYIESAHLLGTRTAEMHAALASRPDNPDFAPETFNSEYAAVAYGEMQHEADRAFQLLRDKQDTLTGDAAESAKRLLRAEAQVLQRFSSFRNAKISAMRIRHHGDYHLGQVLYTGHDFVIIDFEGEPARPLSARRMKALAMRDVAGMVRSFSYAAYAALFGQVEGVPADAASCARVEAWGTFWASTVSREFLKSYLSKAHGSSFAGTDAGEQRLLFDAFVLQKALYEVAYELNNRPDWVQIPLSGILGLIG